jgi:hypothetical protein
MGQYDWLRSWVASYKKQTGINVSSPISPSNYGLRFVNLGDNWATKYKYYPTDVKFEGSMNERISQLKRRGYGNDMINYWIINGNRLVNEHKANLQKIKEDQRIAQELILIEKEKQKALKKIQDEIEIQEKRIEEENRLIALQKVKENQQRIIEKEEIQKEELVISSSKFILISGLIGAVYLVSRK